MKRKLRAILSADVKSYSVHMANNELSTIERLKDYRRIMTSKVTQSYGRVVDTVGDNMLADFESAVDAVQCAVNIQQELKIRNSELRNDEKLEFRIGINIGDIMKDGESIYGDGVNIAARIESLAKPGGICLSRNVYDQVKNKLKLSYKYLGGHNLKNISDPVWVYKVEIISDRNSKSINLFKTQLYKRKKILISVVYFFFVILFVLSGLYHRYIYLSPPEINEFENENYLDLPKGPSLVILPFDNMTGDPNQEYICDGITEIITSVASYIPELFVIARNSAYAYKGKKKNIKKIGKELGSQFILEGSVQKYSDILRITVQLINTKTGHHIWSETYNRRPDDIFKLQDEIAYKIAKALQIKVTEGEIVHSRFDGITNNKVYNKFLKAWSYLYKVDTANNHLAQKELKEIIEIEPDLANSYIMLAFTYVMDLWYGRCESNIVCYVKINNLIKKAFELDDKNSDAYYVKGALFLMRKDLENAVILFKQAIKLNPNNSAPYSFLGYAYYALGQPQKAIDFCDKAIDLDPVPVSGFYVHLGHGYFLSKDYKNAIKSYKKGLERNPKDKFPYLNLAMVYTTIGKNKEAQYYKSKFLEIDPDFKIKKFLSIPPYSEDTKRLEIVYNRLQKLGFPD